MAVAKETVQFRDDGTFWVQEQWDDATHVVTSFDEPGDVTGTRAYTDEEVAEADERASTSSAAVNRLELRTRAVAALQTNRDFLAKASYTNADVVAQVKALTRQNVGIIRLVAEALDGLD